MVNDKPESKFYAAHLGDSSAVPIWKCDFTFLTAKAISSSVVSV